MEEKKLTDSPVLTMGMPVYNEEKYIGEAIESLLTQAYKDFILIISDNASTDRTQQICECYAKKDKRVVYIRHKENRGAMFNFRYVLEQTNTPFFMWCGGHDKWGPTFVEKLLPAFKEKNVILSYSKSRELNIDGSLGEIYNDDFNTIGINKPILRYLRALRVLRCKGYYNMIYGIWLTSSLRACNFNLKTMAPDINILLQASFEGKFYQHNEILFWSRGIRKGEWYKKMVLRQFSDLSGESEKISAFSLVASFIVDCTKIPFRRRYLLGLITKLWLALYTFCTLIIVFFIRRPIAEFIKKILPEKIYFKLKHFLHKSDEKKY
jgi:glycosyltransferase involved in cell wall biosynthesis